MGLRETISEDGDPTDHNHQRTTDDSREEQYLNYAGCKNHQRMSHRSPLMSLPFADQQAGRGFENNGSISIPQIPRQGIRRYRRNDRI